MPRRGSIKIKEASPDPIYKNRLVTKLVNRAMRDEKKTEIKSEVYGALELIKEKGEDPIKIFSKALDNIRPSMEVRPRRVGGAAYQVPAPVRGGRKESLAIRWLLFAARARPSSEYHTFAEKLAAEIMDAQNGVGGA